MSTKMKTLWGRFGGWLLLLGVPMVLVAIGFTAGQAHKDYTGLPRTQAAPPAESEITFDMDTNKSTTWNGKKRIFWPAFRN